MLDDCQVINGDALEGLQTMSNESYDLVVTDPPYNIGIDYGEGRNADKKENYIPWVKSWVNELYRVLRPGGSMFLICGQEYAADIDKTITAAAFTIRNRITWYETFGVYCHNKFGRTSRPIFYAVKGAGFTFNADAIRVKSVRQKLKDKRANPLGKIPGDVWKFSRVCGNFKERQTGYPTQLPSELVTRCVLVASNKNDKVLDPFSGSATVGVVSKQLGRVFCGIEKNEEYYKKSIERLAKVSG